jgi:gliding motility-associated protein GldM
MGHGKETPRQKMIGLMYLFLTCMLALNVSKDILDAFININNRLNETNTNFISKNQIAYDAIFKAYNANPNKVGDVYRYSQMLQKKSDSLVGRMQYYKDTIIFYADALPKDKLFKLPGNNKYHIYDEDLKDTITLEEKVVQKDNTNIPAQIMVGQDGKNGQAEFLKADIIAYKKWVLSAALKFGADSNTTLGQNIKQSLNTDDVIGHGHESGLIPWAAANFEHLPLMAVITILTQMQASVRNVEGDLLNYMYGNLDATSFKFNKLVPIVVPSSTYIMQGNEYNAAIFLAAFDTTAPPTVIVNGREIGLDPKTNLPTYKAVGGGVGPQKYKAEIKVKKPNTNEFISYFTESEYQVAKPSLVVSPTKMNVFYIGPDNPVDISVPGVPSDKITAVLTPAGFGSISKSAGGGYVVRVNRAGKCQIAVTADFNGKKQNMGAVEFRIKSVPDPVASVLGMDGGEVGKERLGAASTVDAKMKDFDFDLKFTVEAFRVSAKIGAYFVEEVSQNNRITQNMKQNIFSKVTKGNKVYFEDIKARGPDNKPRSLGVLLFKIN